MKELLLLVLLTGVLCGCGTAHRTPRTDLPTAEMAGVKIPAIPQDPVLYRHAVRLEIRGKSPLTFDGMLRFDARQDAARAVALGGFGLKLFDLTITPTDVETHTLHPALARIPDIVDHIAFCIRRIWLDYRPVPTDPAGHGNGQDVLYATCHGQQVEHVLSRGRRISTTAFGPDEFWTTMFLEPDAVTQQPRHIVFTDGHERYRLDIRTIPQ